MFNINDVEDIIKFYIKPIHSKNLVDKPIQYVNFGASSTIWNVNGFILRISNATVDEKEGYEILKKLNIYKNSKIVRLYYGGYFKYNGKLYLYQILENCKGIELFKYVERNFGNYSILFVKNTIREILLGVKFIHSKQIVHNDLKLENIIVSSNGRVKIIDFGVSILLNDKSFIFNDFGSQYYCPNEKPYTSYKTDVYSIGVMLHLMVSCEFPNFKNEISNKIKDPILIDLLKSMLNENYNERFDIESALNHPWFEIN